MHVPRNCHPLPPLSFLLSTDFAPHLTLLCLFIACLPPVRMSAPRERCLLFPSVSPELSTGPGTWQVLTHFVDDIKESCSFVISVVTSTSQEVCDCSMGRGLLGCSPVSVGKTWTVGLRSHCETVTARPKRSNLSGGRWGATEGF